MARPVISQSPSNIGISGMKLSHCMTLLNIVSAKPVSVEETIELLEEIGVKLVDIPQTGQISSFSPPESSALARGPHNPPYDRHTPQPRESNPEDVLSAHFRRSMSLGSPRAPVNPGSSSLRGERLGTVSSYSYHQQAPEGPPPRRPSHTPSVLSTPPAATIPTVMQALSGKKPSPSKKRTTGEQRWYVVTRGTVVGAVFKWSKAQSVTSGISDSCQSWARDEADAVEKFLDAACSPNTIIASDTGRVVNIPNITNVRALEAWVAEEGARRAAS